MTQVMVHYDNGFLLLRGLTVGAGPRAVRPARSICPAGALVITDAGGMLRSRPTMIWTC